MIQSELSSNPFVGLRPFESHESLLFFGRREQTVALMERLHRTRFLSVVGSSGCGKSSLIRAGLIPKLKAGFLAGDRDRWLIALMKPGETPLQNLAAAALEAMGAEPTAEAVRDLLAAVRTSGASALAERLAAATGQTGNFLLLVDQFEEVFRFGLRAGADEEREEAYDFVSIMLSLAEREGLPFYVVITMRSDFLGDCDAFYGLPEAMNRSQYLVPRHTRQQRQEAVEGPVMLYGQRIAPRLLDRVLNDVGELSDQLPVMQHALMRTWEKWAASGDQVIDLKHYEEAGTINNALSRDAFTAMEGASIEDFFLTARLFKLLTDTDAQNRQVRRPARLSEVVAVTGASREKVLQIVQRFRDDGRSFLNVYEDRVGGDYLIDISHESLIRQWEVLRSWVRQEATSRATYLRIADAAARHKRREADLWRNPDLRQALDWRALIGPNAAWAQRYHPHDEGAAAFADAMAFLDRSRRRRRTYYSTLAAVLALALGGVVFFAYQAQAQKARKLEGDLEMQRQKRQAEIALIRQQAINDDRLAQAQQLADEREAQQKLLAEQEKEQERKLAEQRVKQARESERAIAAVKEEEAEKRIQEVNFQRVETEKALRKAQENLDKFLAEQKKTEQALKEAAQQKAVKDELIKEIGNSQPDFSLKYQLIGQVIWEPGPDGEVKFLNDWDNQNLEAALIPELGGIPAPNGQPFSGRVKFYKEAIPQLRAALREIKQRGLLDRIVSWDGSFVARVPRGTTKLLSIHTLGLAFDINSQFNPAGREPAAPGARGSVMELVPIFQKYGFYWGGNFKYKEGGHFEVVKIIKDLPQ